MSGRQLAWKAVAVTMLCLAEVGYMALRKRYPMLPKLSIRH